MAATRIGDHLERKVEQSPQYDFLWRLELPSLANETIDSTSGQVVDANASQGLYGNVQTNSQGLYGNVDTGGTEYVGSAMETLNHRVYSTDIPFQSFEVHKSNGGNRPIFTAHHKDVGSVSITMDEYEDGKTLKYIDDWTRLICRDDGTHNPPAMYKRTLKFYRLSSTKLDLHVTTIEGAWLSEVSPINASQEGDGIMQYNLTLACDSVKHKILSGAAVKAMVSEEEVQVLDNDYEHSKFKFGGIDGQTRGRIFERLVSIL